MGGQAGDDSIATINDFDYRRFSLADGTSIRCRISGYEESRCRKS
jgi:hypothetical protein